MSDLATARPGGAALASALVDAAVQAFESLGYFFVEPLDPGGAPVAGPSAAVEFRGPFSGALVVSVAPQVLAALSANMLGRDDAPEAALQLDALGELANVICGSVLPSLGGPRAVFSLQAPRASVTPDVLAPGRGGPIAHAAFDLDGGRGDVRWFVD